VASALGWEKAVVSGADGITVFDALVLAGSRFHEPIEPTDFAFRSVQFCTDSVPADGRNMTDG
jgi:hypothetical protein